MKRLKRQKNVAEILATICLATVFASAVLLAMPTEAMANWNFDPSCSAIEVSDVEDPAIPNALLMLDQSGSMGTLRDNTGSNSLWNVAVGAIDQAVDSLNEDIRFGLGLFPASNCSQRCFPWPFRSICWTSCGSRSGATEIMVAQPDAHEEIVNTLDDTGPSGGTPTWAAINEIRTSDSMDVSDRSAGGVLITDGQPCCHGSARQDTINAACNARDQGYTTYAVGLGGATDQNFNNKMAAALGTGCCGPAANEDCTNGLGADPCSSNVSGNACYGSYQAYNQTEFRNALLAIGEEIGCTFDIDTSLHEGDESPDDPGAIRVEILLSTGWKALKHRNVSDDGHGWFFPSSGSRDEVTLTSKYCSMVQGGHVDTVETQLACECQETVGTPCQVNNPPDGVCAEGTWSCSSGYDQCVPLEYSQCPTACADSVEGEPCHVQDFDLDLDDIAAGDTFGEGVESTLSRCDVGQIACIQGTGDDVPQPVCEQVYRPMPETCDGMDNSCDGKIDNIEESWEHWENGTGPFAGHTFGMSPVSDSDGAMCAYLDICSCQNGSRDKHVGEGATSTEEFDAYIGGWDAHCSCTAPIGR